MTTPVNSFKTPIKLSDLMKGTSFEISSIQDFQDEVDEMMFDEEVNPDNFSNPCSSSFTELKKEMKAISDGVYKMIKKKPADDAKEIDLKRSRVTYHRNLYVENEDYPFDSTYLNGRADEICMAMEPQLYLEGFLDAISSMKEGEQSLFIVDYKKMLGDLGCKPRVKPKADILCDIKVLKVEQIGDQEAVELILKNDGSMKFADIKSSIQETSDRAKDSFAQKKFKDAINLYRRIVQNLSTCEVVGESEQKQRKDILVGIHMNLAVCHNQREEWNDALFHVSIVEELVNIDEHSKALYAKGFALMKLGEYEQAINSLKKALMLRPTDPSIIAAIEEFGNRKKVYESFNKNFSKNLKLSK